MLIKVNEIQLSYRESFLTSLETVVVSSSNAAKVLYQSFDMDTIALNETFKVLLLNRSNRIKGIYTHSVGGITGTVVDIRLLFAVVLKSLSTGIILCHNHPSGKLEASTPDRELTQKMVKAAGYFDVKVLDHIILSPNGRYFSFADEGIL
ncbi:JAB domain-containing protein [Galbibacter mesophilus]|uniref:JAB domain-containing protein n=1 Tax=Galbibacter mesophilus TaxID=379069 RepID=UPI00191F10D0|nr:JAB domain-containing protein [Galbibacter mesophilus]MCM5662519.1 JAB domain-containing protein [Galbibacter mesophilus]MCM5664016.1 JAB domain-containing protein [Galbibacter mesophilus]